MRRLSMIFCSSWRTRASLSPRVFSAGMSGAVDILSYPDGAIWPDSGSKLPDALVEQAARAIRRYHDVTAGSRLSQGREIVAHHELGPHNTNFQDGHLPEADAGSEQGG